MINRKRKERKWGFTLIELLIVVAIIAILAAIAVPNFLAAQVRSKVSRVQSDMRSIVTAMESYMVDYNTYPYPWEKPDNPGDYGDQPAYTAGTALSTPVAYISNAWVRDPFSKTNTGVRESQYKYKNYIAMATGNSIKAEGKGWPKNCFGLISFGPDKIDDTRFGGYPYERQSKGGWKGPYDPTNGVRSPGDIFRCVPKAPKTYVIDTGRNLSPPEDPFGY